MRRLNKQGADDGTLTARQALNLDYGPYLDYGRKVRNARPQQAHLVRLASRQEASLAPVRSSRNQGTSSPPGAYAHTGLRPAAHAAAATGQFMLIRP
jgi:hypothetical protein